MSRIDVQLHLSRADRLVAASKIALAQSEKKRETLKEEDSFLLRKIEEAAKIQRERSVFSTKPSGYDGKVSNLLKIESVLQDSVQAESGTLTQATRDDCHNFVIDDAPQAPPPPPTGAWATKDIVDQKEYDVDATNNQDANDEEIVAAPRADVTRSVTPQPETVELKRKQDTFRVRKSELTTTRHESIAHELAGVFNRLRSNDAIFFAPVVDEYNSTQFATKHIIEPKMLSLGNGKLLRKFFDSPKEQPHVTYSSRSWSVKRSILESILCGQFGLDDVAAMQEQIVYLQERFSQANSILKACELSLVHERTKTLHLQRQVDALTQRTLEHQRNVLSTAVRIDTAASHIPVERIPVLSALLGRTPSGRSFDNERLFEDVRLVLEKMGTLRESLTQNSDGPYPFFSVETIRKELLGCFTITATHSKILEEWARKEKKRTQRQMWEEKLRSSEMVTMELEDSHSGYNQLFLIGENVYGKMSSIARSLTREQQEEIFGKDLSMIQFYELTRARDSICPLCRFEFDATKPLSFYSEQIQEKTRRVTDEITFLVGRKNAQSTADDDFGGTTTSRKGRQSISSSRQSFRKKENSTPTPVENETEAPQVQSSEATESTPLGEFEAQVALMALQQMIADLQSKTRQMQEKIDEGTAALRLEKMHYQTLDNKYRENLRDSGAYKRRFDEEMKRSAELVEEFRSQVNGLREEINVQKCRIEDLEEIQSEMKEKMERISYAEQQINTIRFGYPVSLAEKRDLSFQEIGYVYFRKYFEVRQQLVALKKRFHITPEEDIPTRDFCCGKEGTSITSFCDASTFCVVRDFVTVRNRLQQCDPPQTCDQESSTEGLSCRFNVDVQDVEMQTAPFEVKHEFPELQCTEETTARDITDHIKDFVVDKVTNPNVPTELLLHLEKTRRLETESYANFAIQKFVVAKDKEMDSLVKQNDAALETKAAEIIKVQSEKQKVIQAYNALLAKVSEAASRGATVNVELPEDLRCSTAELRERATEEVSSEGILKRVQILRRSGDFLGALAEEERLLRRGIEKRSDILMLDFTNTANIIASLHTAVRSCKCRKSVFCSVVQIEMDQNPAALKARLLPPISRDDQLRAKCGPTVAENAKADESYRQYFTQPIDKKAVAIKTFDFDNCNENSPSDEPISSVVIPPLPAVLLPDLQPRRQEKVSRSISEPPSLSALIIKKIASKIAVEKLSRALIASREGGRVQESLQHLSEVHSNVLEQLLHHEEAKLNQLQNDLRQAVGVSMFGPEHAGLVGSTLVVAAPQESKQNTTAGDANTLPFFHHSPKKKVFHGASNRNQAALLAVRLQAQQRLGTPTTGHSTAADANHFLPVMSLKSKDFLEELLTAKTPPPEQLEGPAYMPSFLPRPLPQFKGAIPPATITGTSTDNVVRKPPGGFVGGWHDSAASSAKSKAVSSIIASRIGNAISANRTSQQNPTSTLHVL